MTEKRPAIDTNLPIHLLLLQMASLINELAISVTANSQKPEELKIVLTTLTAIKTALLDVDLDQLNLIRAAEIRSLLGDKYLSYSLPSILCRLQMDKPELPTSELSTNLTNLRHALIKTSLKFFVA